MFSLICARINSWVNNRETGDLRPHRAHYDVTVMNVLTYNLLHHTCVPFNFARFCCGLVPVDFIHTRMLTLLLPNTIRCRYNAINSLQNHHNRQPIVRRKGEILVSFMISKSDLCWVIAYNADRGSWYFINTDVQKYTSDVKLFCYFKSNQIKSNQISLLLYCTAQSYTTYKII